jgi:demethylmenaquinone methyltransferase/2-methoxy-6-polyprenyl-1,4-benzoquinol methylase
VILDLTTPPGRLLRLGHRFCTRCFVPLAGRLLAGSAPAYRYLVDSVRHFPDVSEILAAMTAAGFVEARCLRLTGGVVTLFLGSAP